MRPTLLYIQSQAEHLNIPTPCITFDQPLWLKAIEIIKAKSLNIVCRFGGFHTMMSFMGSIGSMMKSSGLEEALETTCGHNAVTHMISGKAVSRALRGHCLVEAALANKLMVAVLPCEWDEDEASAGELQNDHSTSSEVRDTGIPDKLDASEVEKIGDLFQAIEDKSLPISNVANSEELMKLETCLLKYKALLVEKSPTAKLWLQYIDYVETLKLFIRAERTGDWRLIIHRKNLLHTQRLRYLCRVIISNDENYSVGYVEHLFKQVLCSGYLTTLHITLSSLSKRSEMKGNNKVSRQRES